MKTKVVYAVVSPSEDFYILYELWASIFSLRLYNSSVKVLVCTDRQTKEFVEKKEGLRTIIDEIHIVQNIEQYNLKERSRIIKTSVRQLVEGAYLFLDTDTIVCQNLESIDCIHADVACVPEMHLSLMDNPFRTYVLSNVKSIFNEDFSLCPAYYNSGVMFVDDTPLAHEFCRRWHDNWKYSCFEKGCSQDQPALLKTNKEFDNLIYELNGDYNCQVTMNMCNFHTAKIIHFVHSLIQEGQTISPFYDKGIYLRIRDMGKIDDTIANQISNVKTFYTGVSTVIGSEMISFIYSTTGQIAYKLCKKSKIWQNFLDKLFHRFDQFDRLVLAKIFK